MEVNCFPAMRVVIPCGSGLAWRERSYKPASTTEELEVWNIVFVTPWDSYTQYDSEFRFYRREQVAATAAFVGGYADTVMAKDASAPGDLP